MTVKPFLFFFSMLLFSSLVSAQTSLPPQTVVQTTNPETIEKLTGELGKISKSLQTFNTRLEQFLENLNKYKGIQLSEQQQKLLFGYEVLNQTEQLAATLRKSLIETSEREASVKRRLGQLEIDLKPENIDRSIQLRGTARADEARESRRRALEEERNTLQRLLLEIVESRNQITENLRQTELFAQSFRRSLFSQLSTELSSF